jgi:SAM-dependent methyltransferase
MSDTASYYDRYWRDGVNGWAIESKLSPPMRKLLTARVARQKVLDFGGGEGERYGDLVRLSASTVAIADVSSEVLRIRAARGDTPIRLEEMERHQREFDVLLVLEVLEHLLDPVDMLSAATATLREGGWAIISVPNAFSGMNRARMALGRLPASGVGPPGVRRHTYLAPHIRFFDTASLINLCRRAGLRVSTVRADGLDVWRLSPWIPERLYPVSMKRDASLLANTLVVQAQRVS